MCEQIAWRPSKRIRRVEDFYCDFGCREVDHYSGISKPCSAPSLENPSNCPDHVIFFVLFAFAAIPGLKVICTAILAKIRAMSARLHSQMVVV